MPQLGGELRCPRRAVHRRSDQAAGYSREVPRLRSRARRSVDDFRHALDYSIALIIRKEKDLVALDGPAESAAKLVLVIGRPLSAGKVIRGVEIRIAQELKRVSVVLVGAGFCYDVNLAAAVVPVLGVIIIRQNAKLGDRVEIGNCAGAGKSRLLYKYPIQDETICRFTHAIHGERAGIQIARYLWRGKACGYERARVGSGRLGRRRNDAGLQCQQIGIASSHQRDVGHLLPGNYLAHLSALGIDVQSGAGYLNLFCRRTDLQFHIDHQRRVHIEN